MAMRPGRVQPRLFYKHRAGMSTAPPEKPGDKTLIYLGFACGLYGLAGLVGPEAGEGGPVKFGSSGTC